MRKYYIITYDLEDIAKEIHQEIYGGDLDIDNLNKLQAKRSLLLEELAQAQLEESK